jgi:hypothetical protein
MKYLKELKKQCVLYRIMRRKLFRKILQKIGDVLLATAEMSVGTPYFWYVYYNATQYQMICNYVFNYELK